MDKAKNMDGITEESSTAYNFKEVIHPNVLKRIVKEINIMISFALSNGLVINTDVNSKLGSTEIQDILFIHSLLVKDIHPATPKSIHYLLTMDNESLNRHSYGKIPLVRNLIFLALFFLIGFVGTSLSEQVNPGALSKGVLDNFGISLLINIIFLCSISGLGITFYLLQKISKEIRQGTLIPEDSIYYIALVFLGVISGIILSEIISLYLMSSGVESTNILNKCILALIGGFSSDAIFSVLQSLINKVKQIFSK